MTTHLPKPRSPLVRMAKLSGALVGALALLAGGLFAYSRFWPQHHVLIDNGNDFAIEVDVGGTHVTVAPHATAVAAAHDGTLVVTATGPSGFHETAQLELPASSFFVGGRTAVYNAGGADDLAIVTMEYGAVGGNTTPPVQLLDRRLALVPRGVGGSIDESFPAEVSTNRMGELIQHLCRVDVAAQRIGCPGA